MLHLTNGDKTAELIHAAQIPGSTAPWRDVLHEGPVPRDLDLEQLSDTRVRFIFDQGWTKLTRIELRKEFEYRDQRLRKVPEHQEVVLWFEHALYDQLQLLQILDTIANMDVEETLIHLVSIDRFAGVAQFRGLAQLTPKQIEALWNQREPVTSKQIALAVGAWRAFRSPDPTMLESLLSKSTSALPFLQPAIVRLLEQYPDTVDGCSRSERQILQAMSAGPLTPREIFDAAEALEPVRFMGDTTFWWYLARLGSGEHPLVSLVNGSSELPSPDAADFEITRLVLTPAALEVLSGNCDRVALQGLDRWIGGVHQKTPGAIWRWDKSRLQLGRGVTGA